MKTFAIVLGTVLTLVAFHELQQRIEECGGDRLPHELNGNDEASFFAVFFFEYANGAGERSGNDLDARADL